MPSTPNNARQPNSRFLQSSRSYPTKGFPRERNSLFMKRILHLCPLWFALCCWQAEAQIYDANNDVVHTFAGSGFSGYQDGQGTQTMFNAPMAIVADTSSNLFVVDYYNSRVRRITPDGTVSTFLGGGVGNLPGYGTNVWLGNLSRPMAIDHSNTLWLVGYTYSGGFSLLSARSDGYVTATFLSVAGQSVGGMCADSGNNLYFTDQGGNRIYRYRTNGVLEVFAGSGNQGSLDGNGIFTSFSNPGALAADNADNIYVCDANRLIRKINKNRDVVTIAGNQSFTDSDGVGTNASFYYLSAICADGFGNLYVACYSSIRKINVATNVTTVAGSFTQSGYVDGAGSVARFCGAGDEGICFSQGTIFLADAFNHRIRTITFNPPPHIITQPRPQVSCLGGSATFLVVADGAPPLAYQWYQGSTLLAGETNTQLMLTSLQPTNAGLYSVVVSNLSGTTTSSSAQLVINDACVDLQMYAGLNISGLPGVSYVLKYTTDLTVTNFANWTPLATNTLTSSNWFYLDTNSPFSPKRFYGVKLVP